MPDIQVGDQVSFHYWGKRREGVVVDLNRFLFIEYRNDAGKKKHIKASAVGERITVIAKATTSEPTSEATTDAQTLIREQSVPPGMSGTLEAATVHNDASTRTGPVQPTENAPEGIKVDAKIEVPKPSPELVAALETSLAQLGATSAQTLPPLALDMDGMVADSLRPALEIFCTKVTAAITRSPGNAA
ncbi:MAG: hypothetical protein WC683_05095 [bacterium]